MEQKQSNGYKKHLNLSFYTHIIRFLVLTAD